MKRKYSRDVQLRCKGTKEVVCTIGDVELYVKNSDIIALIKGWRHLTGNGLKDSKDMIESLITRRIDRISNRQVWDSSDEAISKVVDAFVEVASFPKLTKEEFINIIGDAIDNMDRFHCVDMIEACEFLFKGIKAKGGLAKIAQEHEEFLDGI